MNLDAVRDIADAYEQAVRTNAGMQSRDLAQEALACIAGAARCLAYPEDQLESLIKAAVEDVRDPVDGHPC